MPLPVTAIFPIYECADRLGEHLTSAREWLGSVEEVIVVDSGSADGSAEMARHEIKHPNVRHEVVPPGLYAAWNHGIRLAGSEFCYFSTVGDSLAGDGLEHLVYVALSLQADTVISPPLCLNEDGSASDKRIFPIHSILSESELGRPMVLPPWLSWLLSNGFSIESFLGSSASNIYRTRCLQRAPFPTDFGKAGDSAWFRLNALRFRFALTPKHCATFLLHQEHGSKAPGEIATLLGRLNKVSAHAAEQAATLPVATIGEIGILDAWRRLAGAAPEKTLDAIRHLEGIAETNAEQRKYIADLQAEIEKMRAVMEDLEKVCQIREREIAQLKAAGQPGQRMSWLRELLNR